MALQEINPINDQLADIIVRADEPWIETEPGMAWIMARCSAGRFLPAQYPPISRVVGLPWGILRLGS